MKSALSLTMIVCLAGPAFPRGAQDPRADAAWSRVAELPSGGEIIVTIKSSPQVHRYFVSADDSGITVMDRAQAVEDIARADILEISVPVRFSPERDALKGAIVGSAAYGTIGAVACRAFGGSGSCAGGAVKAAVFGGGFTAGISVAAGAVKHLVKQSTRLIYRAP